MQGVKLITVPEAAKLLGVTTHSVYRYTYQGKLRPYKNQRRQVRLCERDVLRFKKEEEFRRADKGE